MAFKDAHEIRYPWNLRMCCRNVVNIWWKGVILDYPGALDLCKRKAGVSEIPGRCCSSDFEDWGEATSHAVGP